MTKDELNRLVSESIEPKPEQPPSAPLTTFATLHSPLKAWHWVIEDRWEPRDFHADEYANAMLLEMMPQGSLRRQKDGNWGAAAADYPPRGCAINLDRKTAICLAFAKWKRVEIDE